MTPRQPTLPAATEQLFIRVHAALKASLDGKTQPTGELLDDALKLADEILKQGPLPSQQTARSMSSFLRGMQGRTLDAQDCIQLDLLLNNLQRELWHAPLNETAGTSLVTPVAPSQHRDNDRIALYIESRAISAMLQEMLTQAGFSPRPLLSMQELARVAANECPVAIVADLSLCMRDPETRAVITGLRERFSPPPHLFALASADNIEARLQAVRLGATRFLQKPVDGERLIAVLKGVTARTRTETFRVLFIDDDRAMTQLYTAAMAAAGIEARTVNDPMAAPAAVAEFTPDVIVTDVYMPTCNGLELAALLRQDESLADTPILFLSSETNIQRQMSALDLGADDFLSKPVNVEVLQAAVIARAKRARMLKRSRREYQQVAEHLQRIELAIDRHSIVSISDLDGNITYVNQRFCDISGYSTEEALGEKHNLVKSHVHPPEFFQDMWSTLKRGRTWHGEICNRRKDGRLYWVNATITPQLDELGHPVRFISVRTDITPLKTLQAQLIAAKAEAEAASQAKSTFLAHMSHELKTPLTSILGFSRLMQNDTTAPPSAAQTEMLGAISRASNHLLELITGLVDLARVETGEFGLNPETFPLAPLLRECLDLLQPQAQQHGITLNLAGELPPATVHADRTRSRQVLLNLLSNAVKYNRAHGEVSVSARCEQGRCRIAVRDTGPGIAAEDLPNLFQPFSRLGKTADRAEGVGIGLALSKTLVERMGGHIGVTSPAEGGSEFWFALPQFPTTTPRT